MRALLIGGSGFIGSFLVPALEQRDVEIAVLTRGQSSTPMSDRLTRIVGDRKRLADSRREIQAFAPDVVIDLVLSSGTQARELMSIMKGIAGRVVALSSMDVYRACGMLHGLEDGPLEPVPLTEESALRTKLTTYPAAQIAFLKNVFGWLDDEYDKIPVERALREDDELPSTILRLPMVYGPGDPLHRFFPLVRRMEDDRPAILMTAPMAAWRSPRGFVGNVAAAIALAATNNNATGRTYNVAEQPSYSELEWGRRVAESMRWSGDFVVMSPDDLPAHLRSPAKYEQHWSADSSRIRSDLGYSEPVPLDDAIVETIEWERRNPPTIPLAAIDYPAEDAALAAADRKDHHLTSS